MSKEIKSLIKVYEWCPNCQQDVKLEVEKPQTYTNCPNCGEPILPCSLCDMDEVKCSECKAEKPPLIKPDRIFKVSKNVFYIEANAKSFQVKQGELLALSGNTMIIEDNEGQCLSINVRFAAPTRAELASLCKYLILSQIH